jgi:hypothetical protein
VRGFVGLISALPSWLYLRVICPVAAPLGSWLSGRLLGHRISAQAFQYRVLVSLRGLQFGYPHALAPFEVNLPDSPYASQTRTVAFFAKASDLKAALDAHR